MTDLNSLHYQIHQTFDELDQKLQNAYHRKVQSLSDERDSVSQELQREFVALYARIQAVMDHVLEDEMNDTRQHQLKNVQEELQLSYEDRMKELNEGYDDKIKEIKNIKISQQIILDNRRHDFINRVKETLKKKHDCNEGTECKD